MSKLPEPRRSMTGEIRRDRANARESRNSSPFSGTGVHPNGLQGLDSDNYVPAASGFRLNGGTGVIEAKDVILYDLPNSMLASPVLPARLHADASNFAVTTSWAAVASVSTTVPDGYSQALILNLAAGATAYNNTAAVDFLYVSADMSGTTLGGWTIGSVDVDATGTGVAYDFRTGLATGLTPGATVTFSLEVSTAFGTWAAINANVANLDVAMLWLR